MELTSRHRQFMQHLRSHDWDKATALPHSPTVIARLLANEWIERQGTGSALSYRLTENGLAAKKRRFVYIDLAPPTTFNISMPALARRKSTECHECCYIYYDGVQVGAIARRAGAPVDSNPWGWSCGFYPGMKPGEHQDGTAATFEAARADFDTLRGIA